MRAVWQWWLGQDLVEQVVGVLSVALSIFLFWRAREQTRSAWSIRRKNDGASYWKIKKRDRKRAPPRVLPDSQLRDFTATELLLFRGGGGESPAAAPSSTGDAASANSFPASSSASSSTSAAATTTTTTTFTDLLLIAVKGVVYDVSWNTALYGPGQEYHCLLGRDASKALAVNDLSTVFAADQSLSALTDTQRGILDKWELKFQSKYVILGRLIANGPVDT